MSLVVRQCKPKTVIEAVTATLEFESHLKASAADYNKNQSNESSTANQLIHQLQCLVDTLNQLQQRLEASGLWYPSMPPNLSGRGSCRHTWYRSVSWGHVVCRRCKQEGHYAKGCAST